MDQNQPNTNPQPVENNTNTPKKDSGLAVKDRLKLTYEALRSKKKIVATIFGFLLLTTSVGVGVILTQRQQKTGVSAAGVNLALSSNTTAPFVGDTFVVAVSMTPNGYPVNGVDLRIKYNPTLVQATSITPATLLPNVLIPGSITSGVASIVISAPIDSNGAHPVTASGLIAQVTFKALAAGTASITFGTDTVVSVQNQTYNYAGTLSPVAIPIRPIGSATPVRTPTRTPTGVATATPVRTPTGIPTRTPTVVPTRTPTRTPTGLPTRTPTRTPTAIPTRTPTRTPTGIPTRTPTIVPTRTPTRTPTGVATATPTGLATNTPTPAPIPGDIDGDGHVNIVDVGILVDNYDQDPVPDPRADIDGDGKVTIVDVGILIDNYEL